VAGPGNILIKVGAEAGQAVRELSTVNRALGDTMTSSEKMGAGMRKAALPAAAALGAIAVAGVGAAKAAAEDAAEQEHLAGVLERTTGATKAQVAQTEDWIASLSRATGVSDSELRPALEAIVTSTGDLTKSQTLMSQALDISAASGKDISTVSTAIAKGYQGSTAALAKLVPGLSEGARKSKDFSVIMAELQEKTGGAAGEAAGTAAGQWKILTNQIGELQEALGAALLPVIDSLMPVLLRLSDFAGGNTKAITLLVAAIAALAAGILVINGVMKVYNALQLVTRAATVVWTAAQWLLNAALTANPIGLVVVALAALAVGLVVAYRKSSTFREIVAGAMDAVRVAVSALVGAFRTLLAAASSAFDWIVAHWKLALFAFGPLGAAVYLIITNFRTLEAVAKAVAGTVAAAIRTISDAIAGVVDAVKELIGWLGRVHVPHIDLPGPFAFGAVPGPSSRSSSSSSSRAAPAPVTINVTGALDPEGTARAILRVLNAHNRRQGTSLAGLF
jgi:hypothetical protein